LRRLTFGDNTRGDNTRADCAVVQSSLRVAAILASFARQSETREHNGIELPFAGVVDENREWAIVIEVGPAETVPIRRGPNVGAPPRAIGATGTRCVGLLTQNPKFADEDSICWNLVLACPGGDCSKTVFDQLRPCPTVL
jgi:hypothetical protein